MTPRKLVYIASPYAGDMENDIEFAIQASRYAISQGYVPVVPHLLYPQMLDDMAPNEREIGMELGLRLLEQCDEIWQCGDVVSSGMATELNRAAFLSIPARMLDRDILVPPGNIVENWNMGRSQYAPLAEYRIFATIKDVDGGILQEGHIGDGKNPIRFPTEQDANSFRDDLLNLRVTHVPLVEYSVQQISALDICDVSDCIDVKRIRQMETMLPKGLPFELGKAEYGNTGGGFYVTSVQVRMPILNKTVWLNASEDYVTVTSNNHVWGTEEEWSKEPDAVTIFEAEKGSMDLAECGAWLPMIDALMEIHIEKSLAYHGRCIVETEWLPQSIRERLGAESYASLREKAYSATVTHDTVSVRYYREGYDQQSEYPLKPDESPGMDMAP